MDFWQIIRDGGAVGVMALALAGIYLGWWVPGNLHRREIARADRAEKRAERAEMIALKASGATEAMLDVVRGRHPEGDS